MKVRAVQTFHFGQGPQLASAGQVFDSADPNCRMSEAEMRIFRDHGRVVVFDDEGTETPTPVPVEAVPAAMEKAAAAKPAAHDKKPAPKPKKPRTPRRRK